MNSRERVLRVFKKEAVDRVPCFSGMGNITETGINELGYRFAGIHLDAKQMAETAATSYKLFGYECGVVPVDLCVEAEAMGCVINVYPQAEGILYPTIKEKLIHNEAEMDTIKLPDGFSEKGRIPLMRSAISLLKADIGKDVVVGSYVLGPFTLAGQIMELNDLLKLSFKKADKVAKLLDLCADAIILTAKEYEKAGVDFITVREMGATSDVLSPRVFKSLILPPLQKVLKSISVYSVLHICGKTNDIVTSMMEAGPTGISVEQKNDVAESRKKLGPDALIFGNMDAYNVLVSGSEDVVRQSVRKCIDDGVSGVWPGCDIWPTVPPQNMKAMMEETISYGGKK
jgi:[methyl-Co(III) methanol-specific corrinoid protein]:coenzyme M methyltransferase